MRGLLRRRVSLGVVLGALLAGLLATPALAGHSTRWVDDDAGGGGGPAACATAGYTSIQDAIDASSNWDRVLVCPGTYAEQLTIDVKGLLVKSRPRNGAHIVAPETMTPGGDGLDVLVRMTSYGARLVGFDIDIAAGDAVATSEVTSSDVDCSAVDVAVFALGQRNRVNHNFIDSIGDYTYSGECGYYYGIVVGADVPTASSFGDPYPLETSRVSDNVVRDFKVGGILAEGPDTQARIDKNSVRYVHRDDPNACDFVAGASTVGPSSVCPASLPVASGSVNGVFPYSLGIGAEGYALVSIDNNEVYSAAELFGTAGASLEVGIGTMGVGEGSRIRANHVHNAFVGIGLNTLGVGASVGASSVAGSTVKHNNVTDSVYGIGVDSDENNIHHNKSRLNVFGIYVTGEDNLIHDNNFFANFNFDCVDDTSGTGTADTANNWWNDLGYSDVPSGICSSPL